MRKPVIVSYKDRTLLFLSGLCLSFYPLICPGFAHAQTANLPPSSPGLEAPTPEVSSKYSTLAVIDESIKVARHEVNDKIKDLRLATEDRKPGILEELNKLRLRLDALKNDFAEIATGIDLDSFVASPSRPFDWREEIQDLFGPIIKEMKGLTARPREIEKLRGELAFYRQRMPIAKKAVRNIKGLATGTVDRRLKRRLEAMAREWEKKSRDITNKIAVIEYQLNEKLRERKPFFEEAESLLRNFFKTRGKHLFLAVLVFVLVLFFLRSFHRVLLRVSPAHKRGKRSQYVRVFDVFYHFSAFLGAVGALLLALYVSGDWVLMALALIFLFGVAWAAKKGLPQFWEQCKTLLNLGTVRDNERLVYGGVPWRVANLNIYTNLVNPLLRGGGMRLPIRELIHYHSRPFHPDEPWFPCKEQDWVALDDGTRGKVVLQTPEVVQIILMGGSHKTYGTEAFLSQNPVNLSTNFRIRVVFGVDYRHQAISTGRVPDTLRQRIIHGLGSMGFGGDLVNASAEFKQAGASSLDIEIIADFLGRAAKDMEGLERAIQRMAVETCNEMGWTIPFNQLTLHTAETPENAV